MRLMVHIDDRAEQALEHLGARSSEAIKRGTLKSALLLGRAIATNVERFKETKGTRRLARSFLTPRSEGLLSFVLGAESPVYSTIHEFGGTIRAKSAPWLVFMTADGEWHSVKEVHISEKRYARDALDADDRRERAALLIGAELVEEFHP